MRFQFIAVEKVHHSLARLCRCLCVTRSGFYAWRRRQLSRRAQTDVVLRERIRHIHTASHGTYGAPRIHAELRAGGTRTGKKRVARLMRSVGVAGRCPKRFRQIRRKWPAT